MTGITFRPAGNFAPPGRVLQDDQDSKQTWTNEVDLDSLVVFHVSRRSGQTRGNHTHVFDEVIMPDDRTDLYCKLERLGKKDEKGSLLSAGITKAAVRQ